MKSITKTLFALFLTFSSLSYGQNKSSIEVEQDVYRNAKKYRDFEVARSALYRLIVLSDNKGAYKDTLAQFYFETGAYTECILLTTDILSKSPIRAEILNIRAISKQSIGLSKKALEDYEKLNQLEPSISNVYQIATLQYGLGRFGECEQSINMILKDPKSKEETITIIVGQNQQKVMLMAAVYNMKGVLYKDLNKLSDAKNYFNLALELQPDFVLAKGNLEVVQNEENSKVDEPQPAIENTNEKSTKKSKKK